MKQNMLRALPAFGAALVLLAFAACDTVLMPLGYTPREKPPVPATYTVTFDINNGDAEADPYATITVTAPATTAGEQMPANPARGGYGFGGWNTAATGEDGTSEPFTAETEVTTDITVYAKWTANTYTVTFNRNGGDTEASPQTKTVTHPATATGTLPAEPTKAHYAFTGWNTAPAGAEGGGTPFTATTAVTEDTTVYAQWAGNTYTVTFDSGEADTPADPGSIDVTRPDTTVAALPDEPAKEGFTFNGWFTAAELGTAFTAATEVTKDITVYAQWVFKAPSSRTVTFDRNGGTTDASPKTKTVNYPATTVGTLPEQPPARPGYAFKGWNTEPDGADGGGTEFKADTPVPASITVYAQWEAESYTVTFNANGGDSQASPYATIDVTAPVTTVVNLPAQPTKAKHTFIEWNTAANGSGTPFTKDTPVTKSITVYAKWQAITYTVTFDSNGGTYVEPQSVLQGGKAARPESEWSGYVLEGWYRELDYRNLWNFESGIVSANMTLFAKWLDARTVTFNANGGMFSGGGTVVERVVGHGKTVELPASPTRNEYHFVDWYTQATDGEPFNTVTPITAATTVYARWSYGYTTIAEITAYLASIAGGTNADNAVKLPVNMNIGDMTQAGSGWRQLLDEINARGKYVELDLTACTMSGNEFNPDYNVSTGKNRIASLVLPAAATSIAAGDSDTRAFKFFTALKTVSGANVASIGEYAFYNCTSLGSASFPAAATIGYFAFRGCTSLASVSFPAVTDIGIYAFGDCTGLGSASFPAAATIGSAAFYGCTSLVSASFPAVTDIGIYAFSDCTSLASVSFPAAASIDSLAFDGCTSLVSFAVTGSGSLSVAEGGKALVRNGTELVAYPSASGSITIDGITSIGDGAFYGCTSLASASFPAAESIGGFAFWGCTSLNSVSFPAAASIGSSAFRGCTSLASASFPAAESIGNSAFRGTGSTALTITLGAAAPTVRTEIFYDVTAAKTVTVRYPTNATGYGTAPVKTDTTIINWGNAFRGLGWDGTGYLTGTVNSNITLVYEPYTPTGGQ